MRDAFRIANEGRKGPVLVDVTKDVTDAMVDYEPVPNYPLKEIKDKDEETKLKKFVKYINEAQKPLLMVGGGAISAEAAEQVRAVMEKTDMPVVNTLMGLGIVPSSEKRCFGLLGMHGSYAANRSAAEADFILAVGTRFSDRVALNPSKFGKKA